MQSLMMTPLYLVPRLILTMVLSFITFIILTSITTAASGQSWLGDNFPTALLYGSLLEANTYLMSDAEKMAMLDKRYNDAMVELLGLGEGKNTRDSYRSGQPRISVKGSRGPA